MIKPDYHNSIVNLTTSLATGLGAPLTLYPPLRQLPPATVAAAGHVVLVIVDGLGDRYVRANGGLFAEYRLAPLSSVFPSSTAPAITALLTGVAPQQHGVTGWFMLLRELGAVALPLPWRLRGGGALANVGFSPADVIAAPSVFDRLTTDGHFLLPQALVDSLYSQAVAGRARRHGFTTLAELPAALRDLVGHGGRRRFIVVYWPQFDALCHVHGVASAAARQHYNELAQTFSEVLRELAGSDTLLIATADHGFIDTRPQTVVALADHPELMDYLALPLCGEPRAVYCHVRSHKSACFERYARDALAPYMACYPSQTLIEAGWFGRGEPCPQLRHRVGDYTLVARDDYVLYDRLGSEPPWTLIGVHGGLSAAEMEVPLLVAHCG